MENKNTFNPIPERQRKIYELEAEKACKEFAETFDSLSDKGKCIAITAHYYRLYIAKEEMDYVLRDKINTLKSQVEQLKKQIK